MKEWCLQHWVMTAILAFFLIIAIEGAIKNICTVLITIFGRKK